MIRLMCRTLVAVAIALLPGLAHGQNVSGTLSGTIVDQQGQAIPGATVTVINESTTDARVVVSDARGNFQALNLQPGTYTIRVEMHSFRTIERKGTMLTAA